MSLGKIHAQLATVGMTVSISEVCYYFCGGQNTILLKAFAHFQLCYGETLQYLKCSLVLFSFLIIIFHNFMFMKFAIYCN